MENKKELIVIINGSRQFTNYSLLEKECYNILIPYMENYKIIIREGDARGADKLAERFAKENNLGLEIFKAKWDILGKRAGLIRNIQMIEGIIEGDKTYKSADIMISFNMGTPGTTHAINYMKSKYPNKLIFEIIC